MYGGAVGGFGDNVSNPPNAPAVTCFGSTVTMTAEPGSAIYYTLDGRDPNPASAEYIEPLRPGIGKLLVKAFAVRDGVGSTVASAYYDYTPRNMTITPDSGNFEIQVDVTITADHDEVRYTLDGSIPTSSSPLYSGPIAISQEGTATITAAMFHGGQLVGDAVRRRYTITEARLLKPTILPVGGTYEVPLRVNISGLGTIRYTLSGEDPTETSPMYTGTLVIPTPSSHLVVKATSFHERSRHLDSLVADATYEVIATTTLEDGRQEHALRVDNIEFANNKDEEAARGKAEEVMAWLLASAEEKERRSEEVERLREAIERDRDAYRERSAQVKQFEADLGVANARKAQLESQKATFMSVAQKDVNHRIENLNAQQESLQRKKESVLVQLEEARKFYGEGQAHIANARTSVAALKQRLEDRYLQNKRALNEASGSLKPEVELSRMVLAEERHEIALLESAMQSIQDSAVARSPGGFLSPKKRLVDVPVVESVVAVPVGMMRAITTIRGGGLQKLRQNHGVDAHIVTLGNGLGIKVVGHSRGVHNCVEAIEATLTSGSQQQLE